MILSLTLKSLCNRKFSAILVVISIALSITLLLGVERLRVQSLKSFARSVSGVDLIVGAQTGSLNLLLYSIFYSGSISKNISLDGYDYLVEHNSVRWAVPIALGDSHRGYPLVGTTEEFFTHINIGRKESLSVAKGKWFSNDRQVVLGAEVADALGYDLTTEIVIAHGGGDVTFIEHDSHPFAVSGVLARSGTPIDRAIYTSLAGIDEMHAEFNVLENSVGFHIEKPDESDKPGTDQQEVHDHSEDQHSQLNHDEHDSDHTDDEHADEKHDDHGEHQRLDYKGGLSAVLLGLESRQAALFVQRDINEHTGEALTAIIPGVALQELWSLVGYIEVGLLSISVFVVVIGLVGMFIALMSTLDQRRREMAIFRAVGAGPGFIMAMIVLEAVILTAISMFAGVLLVYCLMTIAQPLVLEMSGLYLEITMLSNRELFLLAGVMFASILVSVIPGYRIYRYSVSDGITVRF